MTVLFNLPGGFDRLITFSHTYCLDFPYIETKESDIKKKFLFKIVLL